MKKFLQCTITAEDVKNDLGYISPTNCLLATALKRTYPNKRVLVSPKDVCLNDDSYYLIPNEYNAYCKMYDIETNMPLKSMIGKTIKFTSV
jgi:hypothetical protein